MPRLARPFGLRPSALLALSPAAAIFVSSNIANVGNLAYNMLFSRWLGPELFGDLALLLTLKLGVLAALSAVQMAISKMVAAQGGAALSEPLARLARGALMIGGIALPLCLFALWAMGAGAALSLSDPRALMLLAVALPFAMPLCLLRGVLTGQLAVGAVIRSTQVEMLVRLAGGALAWHLGVGLEGITAALALSIVLGWAVIARDIPAKAAAAAPQTRRLLGGLTLAALPFGLLQLAQVALLDGDLFLAKRLLGPAETGQLAVLALFQRIEFFACFGLASVLLPTVGLALARGESGLAAARPVALLFAAVSLPLLAAAALIPETLVRLLAGSAYDAAAAHLLPAAGAATAFTLSYLVATFLAARSDYRGIAMLAAAVPVYLGAVALAAHLAGTADLALLVTLKAQIQTGLAALMLALAILRPATLPRSTARPA